MTDDFNDVLWSIAKDSPDVQQAILGNGTNGAGYSIPVIRRSQLTEEVGDIHVYYQDICNLTGADEAEEKRMVQTIKAIDTFTIGKLAEHLNYLRVALMLKEAKGEELTATESTLRDIDIVMLAMTILATCKKELEYPPHEEPIREE